MSYKETIGVVLFLCLVVAVVGTVITEAILMSIVDYSQAKFEPGQVVILKAGGKAQVLQRMGSNEGTWHGDLTPVFEYRLRRPDGWKIKYQEWEIDHVEER